MKKVQDCMKCPRVTGEMGPDVTSKAKKNQEYKLKRDQGY